MSVFEGRADGKTRGRVCKRRPSAPGTLVISHKALPEFGSGLRTLWGSQEKRPEQQCLGDQELSSAPFNAASSTPTWPHLRCNHTVCGQWPGAGGVPTVEGAASLQCEQLGGSLGYGGAGDRQAAPLQQPVRAQSGCSPPSPTVSSSPSSPTPRV